MSIYKIDSPIAKFSIIKPHMPLHQWLESGRYIDQGDICELYRTVEDKTVQVRVVYPSGTVKRTAYVKDLTAFTAVQ